MLLNRVASNKYLLSLTFVERFLGIGSVRVKAVYVSVEMGFAFIPAIV
jgi:hypothetical protein